MVTATTENNSPMNNETRSDRNATINTTWRRDPTKKCKKNKKKKRVVINWSVQKKFLMNQDYIIRKCVMEWMRHRDMAKQLWVSQPQLSKCIRKRKDAQAKKSFQNNQRFYFDNP